MASIPTPLPPGSDPDFLAEDARLDRLLESDGLLPLPRGLISAVLTRIALEPMPSDSEADAGPVPALFGPSKDSRAVESRVVGSRAIRHLRPGRLVAMAAAVLLAIGAGIGGLWTATTGDALEVLGRSTGASSSGGAVASIVDLATATRASTSASVRSLASVPEQLPGSPVALGAGSLVLLGAAIFGARRRGGEFARGPSSDAGVSHARARDGSSS